MTERGAQQVDAGRDDASAALAGPTPDEAAVPAQRWAGSEEIERDLAMVDALFAEATLGLGLFDTDLRYVRVNDVLRGIIGLPDAQLLGRTIAEAMPGFGHEVIGYMRQALDTGEPVLGVELWGRTPARQEGRCFSCSYFRLHGAGRSPLGIASVVVDVTEGRAAERAVAAATERLTLLSRAGRLLGSTLDIEETLAALAELTVPSFADHCIVDLVGAEGTFRRIALVHADNVPPDGEAWRGSQGTVTYPEHHPVAQVVRTRGGVLVPRIDEEHILRTAPTPASAAYGRTVGLHSTVVVPLLAHGTALGAISFATSVSGRTYDETDLDLATDIAGRTAVALDNAQRYQREREVALALQRSLLPRRLADTSGLATEHAYLPGGAESTVGGDWFDTIALPGGRTGVVVGDVMGRGLHAAAVMGQLRAAVRSCAVLELAPGALLSHLDDLVQALDEVQIVTCVYGIYDPRLATMTLANAGHPPPLLLDGSGCRPLPVDPGPPLGVGRPCYVEHAVEVPAEAALVFYTDGLVERRGGDIDAGIAQLCAALASAPRDGSLCRAALDTLGAGDAHDDVAVLVVRPEACTQSAVGAEALLAMTPGAPAMARRLVGGALREWGLDDRVDVATLLVSELVTNAVRHARSEVTVRVQRRSDRVVVEVGDRDSRLPVPAPPGLTDDGGRGMRLVTAYAARWGVRPTPTGKVIWVEL